jgi:hypothetical protein
VGGLETLERGHHRREDGDGPFSSRPSDRHVPNVEVGRPFLSMQRVVLAPDEEQPEVREGREDRRPRPHDNAIPAVRDLEPRPVPRPLVSPEEASNVPAERIHHPSYRRRQRIHLRHQDNRRPARRKRRAHTLNGERPLLPRRAPDDVRARPVTKRAEQPGSVHIPVGEQR